MDAIDFLHQENPPTWAEVEPATVGAEGQRQTNNTTQLVHTLSNDTVSRRIDDIAEDVEQQLFGKLRDKLFSIQLDEATDSNKDAHFIAYVRFWDASYEWVRDPFQNTPEELSTTEEEIFIDFKSSGEIKRQFCNKTIFQFWAEVDDEFSELKTKAFRILLPFSTSYLCETGFSAVAALKTKYRSQLNIEKELKSVNF
ncbi:zinc finger BED domain-containing protein 5 [Trichonephila clavipes]|nr:zinc finger BED domain-containing protein 5 [Trichonephila clavipes]